jgi:hypothetical protein
VYESRPLVVIITLGNKLYRIPEIAPPTTISLVTAKQCSKLISKTRKFVFLMIHPQGKRRTMAMTSRQGPTARKQQMDKVVEEYEDIFTSPAGVPLHCQVKHPIDLTVVCTAQWTHLPVLCPERMMKSRGRLRSCCKKVTSVEFIALWEPDRIGAEEGWDLETLH